MLFHILLPVGMLCLILYFFVEGHCEVEDEWYFTGALIKKHLLASSGPWESN